MLSLNLADVVIRQGLESEAGLIAYLRFASLFCLEMPGQALADIRSLMSALPDVDGPLLAGGSYVVADRHGELLGGAGWSVLPLTFRGDFLRDENGRPTSVAVQAGSVLLRGFFLDPDMGRRGIAAALLAQVEAGAAAQGHAATEVVIPAAAQLHYRGLGFRPVARLSLLLRRGNTLPLLQMRKAFPLRLAAAA
jgi:GNAT superfamily N-acetyltransferase